MGRVEGKVCVITGAAKGLGEADARLLAKEGARVILTDVDEEAGRRVAADIGKSASFLRQDVTQEEGWIALIAAVTKEHGRLDVLVNNAGIVEAGTMETTTADQYRRTMAVSADATFFGCKHAIAAMRQTGGGSIINMASVGSARGLWRMPAYSAAKAAVEGITRAVAAHCVQFDLPIRCNALRPAAFDTPMVRNVGAPSAALGPSRFPSVAAGRGDPADVASVVLFLASDDSRFVSGQSLTIDNGALVYF